MICSGVVKFPLIYLYPCPSLLSHEAHELAPINNTNLQVKNAGKSNCLIITKKHFMQDLTRKYDKNYLLTIAESHHKEK